MKNGTPGRSFKPGKFICTKCQHADHAGCIDLVRAKVNLERICECPKHKTPSK